MAVIEGTSGNDVLTSGVGGDTVRGGAGDDVLVLRGRAAGYRVSTDGSHVTVMDTDATDGDDGLDTLSSIETLRFADGNVGLAIQGEFRVNAGMADFTGAPAVAALADGGYVVAWCAFEDVWVKRYASNGVPVGTEYRVNSPAPLSEASPSVAVLSDGGFVITWMRNAHDGSDWDIYGYRFDKDGSARGGEFRINSLTQGDQGLPFVSATTDGGFVVTWMSAEHGESFVFDISAQRYAADGTAVGNEFRVNTYRSGSQTVPVVNPLSGGGFVIAWDSTTWSSQIAEGNGIFAQRFEADGTLTGGELRVSAYQETANPEAPAITSLPGGDFVVVWNSLGSDGIFGRRYSVDGAPLGEQFQLNTTARGYQIGTAVAGLGDAGFMAAWVAAGSEGDGECASTNWQVIVGESPTQERSSEPS